jgi:hypothetical protein
MACEHKALLVGAANPFLLPVNPGPNTIYDHLLTPLTRMEQATIDTTFNRQKHFFLLMQNIKHACFRALDASINDAFKG